MIKKITFRNEVKRELLEAMFRGEITPGQRVSLPSIAKKLEVSVTPVREALTQLTESRVVTYIANRGFIVSELSEQEAIELYEVIGILESSALEQCNLDQLDIKKLDDIQAKFSRAKTKEKRVYYDMAFHSFLMEACPNSLIRKMIEDLRIRVFFYELEYMSLDDLKEVSTDSHDQMIQHLKNKKLKKAAQILKSNWISSIDNISSKM